MVLLWTGLDPVQWLWQNFPRSVPFCGSKMLELQILQHTTDQRLSKWQWSLLGFVRVCIWCHLGFLWKQCQFMCVLHWVRSNTRMGIATARWATFRGRTMVHVDLVWGRSWVRYVGGFRLGPLVAISVCVFQCYRVIFNDFALQISFC